MRSMSALVIDGAARKSMSAMPMPTWTLSLPYVRFGESYLVESVPNRLYGVSKSYLPSIGSVHRADPAAAAASGVPEPTAPATAVMLTLRRNDLRFSPSCCDMRVLPEGGLWPCRTEQSY